MNRSRHRPARGTYERLACGDWIDPCLAACTNLPHRWSRNIRRLRASPMEGDLYQAVEWCEFINLAQAAKVYRVKRNISNDLQQIIHALYKDAYAVAYALKFMKFFHPLKPYFQAPYGYMCNMCMNLYVHVTCVWSEICMTVTCVQKK